MAKTQAQLKANQTPINRVYQTEKPNAALIERARAHRAKLEGNLGLLNAMVDKFKGTGGGDLSFDYVKAWRQLVNITLSEIDKATSFLNGDNHDQN